ncbi:hypothetical protein HIM_11546 [Hirsutella minnesotensis 3608]|uniref:Uncharacterized protein n=1 Tax=Hirsutella minnesotensis 3608 TaxID=1043627 RepID=A0A0F7ZR63_9HYPO|nr:hypothetical protein HIM_11546 [Hirsutella minnesotensis 3608]
MQGEVTAEAVTEAGIVYAMTVVVLGPYLYWMIRVKPREASRKRAWTLISAACLFLGTGLLFAVLFGITKNTSSPDALAYLLFIIWKGLTILCLDAIELIQVVDPLVYAAFTRSLEPHPSVKTRLVIFGPILVLHFPLIGVAVLPPHRSEVDCLWAAPMVSHLGTAIDRTEGVTRDLAGRVPFKCWLAMVGCSCWISILGVARTTGMFLDRVG